jgi:membrane-bound lytic murein transglycosylase B
LAFWKKYPKSLRRAEQEYGVPQEIIVAVIGVETIYGANMGNYLDLDALTTLAFDYPRRAPFFRDELENFLLLAREQDLDLFSVRGSYAGAIGIPQFMPSSYRNFAVDFNHNNKIDLRNEVGDAIGSVANYLQGYGWIKGEPVAVPVEMADTATAGDIKASRSLTDWQRAGAMLPAHLPHHLYARLLEFTLAEGKEYWFGFNNFDVITRYNNSDYYAMTVLQLAQQLKAAHEKAVVKK